MSSQNHSKPDPGKPHDKSEASKNDKIGSPNKWRNPGQVSPSPLSPTNAGPSKPVTGNNLKTMVANQWGNFKKIAGGKDHHPQQQALPSLAKHPIEDIEPLLSIPGGAEYPLAIIGNGLPNGDAHLHQDVTSDNSGTDNYSDHDSASGSSGGGGLESGRISNQSPTDSGTVQLHISALPENVLENIFSFVELGDIRNIASVCHEWYRVVGDENSEVWRTQCFRRMSREVVHSELLSTCPTFKAKLRAHIHSWNPLDCSRNIYVKPNGFTIHRNPIAQSTDGARGKIGKKNVNHTLEMKVFSKIVQLRMFPLI